MQINFKDDKFAYKIFNESLYTSDSLKINNILIPNFYLDYCNNILDKDMMYFELNHLIHKIFLSRRNNLTFYELNDFKIEENDIVFDCGGNMGLFAAAIANRCKCVYSFEPMSLIRKNLYKTANLYNNIYIVPCGLYNKTCEKFLLQKDNPGASSVLKYDNKHNITLYKEKCKLISIDDFVEQTNIIPNFIKIDIEGSELDLLKGAQKCISQYHPKVSIALHFDNNYIIGQIKSLLPKYSVNIVDNKTHGKLLLGEYNEN